MGLLEKIEKAKTLDENIIDLLNGEAMDMELDESLARNKNFHKIFVKIDMCLKTLENELRDVSLSNRPPSSADSGAVLLVPLVTEKLPNNLRLLMARTKNGILKRCYKF